MEDGDWHKTYERINRRWGALGHAGTLNESGAIINALVNSADARGIVDFEKAVCITVMQGWDTDCSGATAGCLAGVLAGRHAIPDKWSAPLHDTFYTCVATERERSIDRFAERMFEASRLVRSNITP